MAGFWEKLFHFIREPQKATQHEVMSGGPAVFTPFSGNAYESDIYRAAVDAIARNAAKLKGKHVVSMGEKRGEGDANLNRILSVRPNPYMTAYDMLYKLVTHYYLYNNAFAFLQKDDRGYLTGIWPLRPQSMEFVTDPTGTMYCRFLFGNGQQVILPYTDVFVARRFFNSNDLLGDSNTAILPTLDVAHAQNEGMENAIKSGGMIRGILKYNQVMAPDKLREEKEQFVNDYLSISNAGGVAALDSKFDYVPLKSEPVTIDDKQIQSIKQKVYDYLGISENIVNSTYSENEWSAFYESTIEPLAVQFALELTDKLFTKREQAFGNSIIFDSNRLQFANNATKTNIIKELMPMGLFTVNQALEILNLPPVEDGDRRLQSLNYVNADKADQYQVNEGSKEE